MAEGDNPFPWGLTPGGKPEDEETPPTPPVAPEPIDQGYFAAVTIEEPTSPAPEGLPTEAMASQEWDGPATEAMPAQEWEGPPTDPFPYHQPAPWEPPPVDESLGGTSNALAAQPIGLDAPVGESVPGENTDAIEDLFGEGSFQEYEDAIVVLEGIPFPGKAVEPAAAPGALVAPPPTLLPAEPMPRLQRNLLWAAGGLVAALALVAVFLGGVRLAPQFAAAPEAPAVPSSAPTLAPESLGPLPAGVHAWSDLLGTECVEPYVSPWDKEFTVVDCSGPHTAQLVATGVFEDSILDAYPGLEELQSRMGQLCSNATNVDYTAAKAYSDIQVSASYAADEQSWIDGDRNYFCFVSRSTGEPLTSSVAMPDRPTPVVPVVPEPEP
ncbi:hypothetical protein EYE40_12055 [Glaciihabitans arcticus]|uniref:Septum formation-related domain-containing protein n=1 Tax=Glaciihabitans arcticus TaxID=2668039 RepID=A0A4Q9GXT8_9MICO|nr:septum formation family protein [Glaciihabitans arcticus]TBN58067.1 hypothetical protein EYE40_12055 [Glaciihabitans arcticus]